MAYSNLIQVIRSKSYAGFIPNYSAGMDKSLDRTEPPVGSKVLLSIYSRYQELWLVQLLFDDLLDWHQWFWSARRLQPLGLICLGSTPIANDPDGSVDTMQGARYESGLDNSPMYDGEFFNASSGQMQLYDVGFSSMVAADAEALAQLAAELGRTEEQALLLAHAAELRGLISQHLWLDEQSVFTNKFPNGTFYPRISPTSFYALMANASTDQQAAAMVESWLLSADRLCVSLTWPQGVNPECYWGLPSINAADPAYPPLGYWRGYVWGPMAQLTYWSLDEYGHVPIVAAARKALAVQMTEMGLNMWRLHGHVCENFNPHEDATECSGTRFYHWGALTFLISFIEAGYM